MYSVLLLVVSIFISFSVLILHYSFYVTNDYLLTVLTNVNVHHKFISMVSPVFPMLPYLTYPTGLLLLKLYLSTPCASYPVSHLGVER